MCSARGRRPAVSTDAWRASCESLYGDVFVQPLDEAVHLDVGQGTVDPAVAFGEVGGEAVRFGDGFPGRVTRSGA